MEWATSYRGDEPSIAPIIIEGFAFLFGFIVTAAMIGAVIGGREVRITTRYAREPGPKRPGGRATARPMTR